MPPPSENQVKALEKLGIFPDQIESADELFLTSSLRGILPVARLGGRTWRPGPVTRALQQQLWREVPALLPGVD